MRFERELSILRDRSLERDRETAEGLRKKLRFLAFLPHFAEVDGKDVALTPAVMDPNIYDGPVKYQIAGKLQGCLQGVIKRRKDFGNLKIGLVDLTVFARAPEMAVHNHKAQVFAASVPKLAAMLAAFQLRHDLRVLLNQKQPKTLDELFSLARDEWAATQIDPGGKPTPFTPGVSLRGKLVLVSGTTWPLGEVNAPLLESVFAKVPAGNPVTIEFSRTGEDKARLETIVDEFNIEFKAGKKGKAREQLAALGFLERLRIMAGGLVPASNFATSTIVRDVSYLYIASTLLQTGLYDTNRNGGLWLGADYFSTVWKGPPAGGVPQSATAGSLAAMMTLLVQNRLMSSQASAEMQALIKKEPNPTHRSTVSPFKNGILRLPNSGSLEIALSKLGDLGGVDDCGFIKRDLGEVEKDGKKIRLSLRYVAVGLRASSYRQLEDLILELDKCILANNDLTPAQGGHS